MTDDVGDIQGPIRNGGVTDDSTPTLSGRGTPGDTVHVYDNGTRLEPVVVVKPDGAWTFTPPVPFINGLHSLTVVFEDPAGNRSDASDPWVVEVDTIPPGRPSIDGLYNNEGASEISIAEGGSTNDTTPVLRGKAEAGATVKIFDKGAPVGTAMANQNGDWEFIPTQAWLAGEHELTVQATDEAGNTSGPSNSWRVSIDISVPDRPSIDAVYDNAGDVQGQVTAGTTIDDPRPVVRGRAEAGSTVKLYDNGNLVGQTVADNQGNWEVRSDTLGLGSHSLTARSTDTAGNVSDPSDAFAFNLIIGDAPAVPAITGVTDDVGDYQGPLQKNDRT
ncbi:Ig-like domain-containing protein, partial [Achromobacter sp. NPDC058515]|uniref:Ig-like domain-containing protein n=1 Tax=Achromobacter sp. NPDC058515 TaxID=3346533 RepID=UPI0036539974